MRKAGKYGEYKKRGVNDRFWEKVAVGEKDDCWEWKASCRHGYGQFGVRAGYIEIAHRYSWIIANGPIPDGLCALHKCDNPKCVNPNHLFLGTRADNTMDMCEKGRNRSRPTLGTKNGASKLSEEQVLGVVTRHTSGESIHSLSRSLKISRPSIKAILVGKTWKWLTGIGQPK